MFSRLILPLTYRCNLDCDYCFVDKHQKKSISLKKALGAVDFLMKNNSQKGKKVEIIFTGGEPLLEWRKILKIILYAKYVAARKGIEIGEIGLPTNGILLERNILDVCKKENIKINISLDGIANKRKTLSKRNSFLIIEKKIPLLLEYKNIIRIKMTAHPECTAEIQKTFKNFLKLGFENIDVQPAMGIRWSEKQKKSYLENLKEIFGYAKIFGKNKKIDIKNLRDFRNRKNTEQSCPKIKQEFLVDTDGKIYPCEFFMALKSEIRKKYCLGDIWKGADMKRSQNCQKIKVCESGENMPKLKSQCSNCKISQACYQICLGIDIERREFNPALAENNWIFAREMEAVFKNHKK